MFTECNGPLMQIPDMQLSSANLPGDKKGNCADINQPNG
jgi:hypothetical protein